MDGFNANWELATILYYDEPEANELPESKLKQATGSEELRSEKKGFDAEIKDRTHNILFISNNPKGVVTLSGTGTGGEDRRYSVMITNKVMTDEAISQGYAKNQDEANVYVNDINKLIKNRTEVSKWLYHILIKHNIMGMDKLMALHGSDYQERFEIQKNTTDNAFDLILPLYKQSNCIPTKQLHQLVMAITENDKHTSRGVLEKFKRYLTKNKMPHIVGKHKVSHTFGGVEQFKSKALTVVLMSDITPPVFEHNLISKTSPSELTIYTKDNIILGQDIEIEEPSNVVELKPTTAAKPNQLDHIKALLQKNKESKE
jgi:hypothetical protein